MKLKKLSVEGITRFDKPVEVDFESLPEGLIAVSGPNGAGKTTLLELSGPGTLFRELPTRSPGGSLSNWRGPKGGRSRLVFDLHGSEYTSEVIVDSRGSMTAFLSKDGEQVVSGKVRDYDAKVSEVVGPKDAFLVSVFGAQGGRGRFSSLKVSERKSIFRYYLGLDRVDTLHKKASEMVSGLSKAAGEMEGLEASIDQTREEVEATEERSGSAFDVIERTSIKLESLRSELEDAVEALSMASLFELYEGAVEELVDIIDNREESEMNIPPAPEGTEPDIRRLREAVEELQLRSMRAGQESRESTRRYLQAIKDRDELKRRASLLREVPCRGEGDFSGCSLIADAREAKSKLSDVLDSLADLKSQSEDGERAAAFALSELENGKATEREATKYLEEWQEQNTLRLQSLQTIEDLKRSEKAARERALKLRQKLPKKKVDEGELKERVDELKSKVEDCEALHDEAVRTHASLEARGEYLGKELERLTKQVEEHRESLDDASALTLLRDALGPNGIQAFEIDAAGPRVSELANDLLRSCYGDRFAVSVTTLKEKKGGGLKEDFAIQVVDSERGPDRDISGLSGGEQVIVDEALRTALSLFAAERNALPVETLWRDETVGGLDGENASRYVQMLHRARKIGGFHRIVYVTHDEKAIEGADGVIRVSAQGEITT